jgi:anti-sigma factor RsiW
MFCDEALDSVEAVAAGDRTPDGRLAAHYASCPNCTTALASARELERLLRQRPTPAPPPQFTARTLSRIRRARWRSEQWLDVGFNLAVGVIVLAMIAGAWMVINRSGLASVSHDAIDVFGRGVVTFARRIAPSIPVYAGATALLATALGVWWWAERGHGAL